MIAAPRPHGIEILDLDTIAEDVQNTAADVKEAAAGFALYAASLGRRATPGGITLDGGDLVALTLFASNFESLAQAADDAATRLALARLGGVH